MANVARAPLRNNLLALLPDAERERLSLRLDGVDLLQGQRLVTAGEPLPAAYFPTTAVVSLVVTLENGDEVETCVIGREGTVGASLSLAEHVSSFDVVCQVSGHAWTMPPPAFREELGRSEALRRLVWRFAQALFIQTSQWVACNRLHSIEQRCARWLLTIHDSLGVDRFSLTHEFLAQMLGVRRASVTTAAGMLRDAGLIAYHRGQIAILDRAGLEEASCECYARVRREYSRLLVPPAPGIAT